MATLKNNETSNSDKILQDLSKECKMGKPLALMTQMGQFKK